MARDGWWDRPPDIGQLRFKGLLKIHWYPYFLTKQGLLEVDICDLLRHEDTSQLCCENRIALPLGTFYEYAQRLLHERCPTKTVIFPDKLRKPVN